MSTTTAQEGGLWRPANGTEGADFSAAWCRYCVNRNGEGDWEDEFGNDVDGGCLICNAALWGDFPHEWVVRDGRPACTAFRQDPANPARCLTTMEMF